MKTIKTRIAALAMALMLAVTAAGCGGGDEAEVTPAVEPPELANPDYSPSVSESTPAPESPSAPPEIANPDSPDYVPSTGSTTIPETEDAGDAYIERITFLGDSTTYGLKAYGMLPGGESTQQVWTPSSGTLTLSNQSWATIVYPPTGEEIPIRDAVTAAQPDIMVITLGVNGVSLTRRRSSPSTRASCPTYRPSARTRSSSATPSTRWNPTMSTSRISTTTRSQRPTAG